jgi:peptidoglycan/LPS O-acetylase OafA/YrhL
MGDKIYFPSLNGLRFIAALLVIIAHVELHKEQLGFTGFAKEVAAFNPGGLGVYFFFVLSGFLITFLLLKEREKSGDIHPGYFYLRRIFRIWPLYYFITILAFFILPQIDFMSAGWLDQFFEENFYINLLLYLFIFPNMAAAINPAVPHAGQLWSIGVEEQFYIAWPWIIRKTNRLLRGLNILFIGILVVKALALLVYKVLGPGSHNWILIIKNFLAMTKFECMVIGAYGAYFFYHRHRILDWVYKPAVFYVSIALIPVIYYVTPPVIDDLVHLPSSLLFIVVILNFATNKNSKLSLESKVFNFLGKISYGIYMYHMMIVVLSIKLMSSLFNIQEFSALQNFALYLLAVGLTIVVSWISFVYFESYFLRRKSKFTIVKSKSG